MRRILVLLALSLTLASCSTLEPFEHNQALLSRMRKPASVISIGPGGMLIRDAKGKYYTIDGADFASLKPGDILQ
jgi:hypothetical protein